MLTAAIVIGLGQPATPPPELSSAGLEEAWSRIRLLGPVLPGDTLSAESVIHAVERDGQDSGRVARTISGRNQRGDVVVEIEETRHVARRARA